MQTNFRKQLDPNYKANRVLPVCDASIAIWYENDKWHGSLFNPATHEEIERAILESQVDYAIAFKGLNVILKAIAKSKGYRVVSSYK